MENEKPWSSEKVAEAHRYNAGEYLNTYDPWHSSFNTWLKNKKDVRIFDIGCGSGKVLGYLTNTNKYVGIDINKICIDSANAQLTSSGQFFNAFGWRDREHIDDNIKELFALDNPNIIPEVKFFLQDIEEEMRKEVTKEMRDCNICYIDSVLTMVEHPFNVLSYLLEQNFEYIFLNRTPFNHSHTVKNSHKWGGMEKESPLWRFSPEFFRLFKEEHYVAYGPDFVVLRSL